ILGIDPGTIRMGYGLIDWGTDGGASAITWGVLTAKPRLSLGERLYSLYLELLELMERYSPDEVAVEEPFVSSNARTALAIGQAQGVSLMVAAARSIPAAGYSPLQVKHAVAGYGGASKEQVQQAIQIRLALGDKEVPEDAADALGVALCHLQAHRISELVIHSP
ncbi:MAG: crossover junction endodeoxyribonuclease RuvC, partial [Dehalococcoidia bacterium]